MSITLVISSQIVHSTTFPSGREHIGKNQRIALDNCLFFEQIIRCIVLFGQRGFGSFRHGPDNIFADCAPVVHEKETIHFTGKANGWYWTRGALCGWYWTRGALCFNKTRLLFQLGRDLFAINSAGEVVMSTLVHEIPLEGLAVYKALQNRTLKTSVSEIEHTDWCCDPEAVIVTCMNQQQENVRLVLLSDIRSNHCRYTTHSSNSEMLKTPEPPVSLPTTFHESHPKIAPVSTEKVARHGHALWARAADMWRRVLSIQFHALGFE
jgi:hypothetical protein